MALCSVHRVIILTLTLIHFLTLKDEPESSYKETASSVMPLPAQPRDANEDQKENQKEDEWEDHQEEARHPFSLKLSQQQASFMEEAAARAYFLENS